jgi:hypothetical protein
MKTFHQYLLDHRIFFLGLLAKGTGALYGIFAMTQFSQVSNLNLWIISGYIPAVIVLANVIIVPSSRTPANHVALAQRFTGSKLARLLLYNIRRDVALLSHFMILIVLLFKDSRLDGIILTINIFVLQGLQIPILLRLLKRNETSYFYLSRTSYMLVSIAGNFISLLSVFAFTLTSTPIDESVTSFCLFIGIQLAVLYFQDLLHLRYVGDQKSELPSRAIEIKKFSKTRVCLSLRMYLFIPCIATLISFVNDSQNEEIAAVFLGLNIMTLLTYLGLPNDKLNHAITSSKEFYRTLKILLTKSLFLFFLIYILLNIFVRFLEFFKLTPEFLMPSGLNLVIQLTFLGVFLMPIIALENNKRLHSEYEYWHLNCGLCTLLLTFLTLFMRGYSTLMESISVSFLSSFIVWYTIAVVQMLKGRKNEV